MKSLTSLARVVALFSAIPVFAVPPTPQPDPSGINKNRYISMSIPDTGGNPVAIRVTLTSLMHPNPPDIECCTPDFSAFEGQYRWVGPSLAYTENDNDPTTFEAAQLQCTPYYADFAAVGLIHVYGDAVVPSSVYDVVVFDGTCNGNEATCTEFSSSLQIKAARWGDTMPPFQIEGGPLNQPSASDYVTVIDKVARINTASKVLMQLQPNIPDPSRTTNVLDTTDDVSSFHKFAYPYAGPTSCDALRPDQLMQVPSSNRGNEPAALRDSPTAKIYITPVPSQGTGSYPAGTTISGQEIHAKSGGFRAFFNIQISDWSPGQTGNNLLQSYEVQAASAGFLSANANPAGVGGDLTQADIPCGQKTCGNGLNVGQVCTSPVQCPRACQGGSNSGNACSTGSNCPGGTCPNAQCLDPCPTIVGEPGSSCGTFVPGKCSGTFINTSRPDYVYSVNGGVGFYPYATPLSPFGPIVATAGDPAGFQVFDAGQKYYAGTFVLDIPSSALGRYTIDVRPLETIVAYWLSSDADERIPLEMAVQSFPAVVDIGGVAGDKNRYLSIGAPDRGEAYAIRVKLTSLMHPNPPNLPQYPPPDFSAYEGQYRWAGPISTYCETFHFPPPCPGNDSQYMVANTQCSPLYSDWHADSSGGVLHITGADIIPSSIYEVDLVPLSCQGNESSCADVVSYVTLRTARLGDTAPPFQQPSPASLSQPDISDVAAEVDKFKTILGLGELTAFVDVHPRIPTGVVNISDVSTCIDAFKNLPYVLGTPTDCP
ncbi:MAG: hypothetical protein HY287_04875 [Planctomycetes bacterium]|nr:hypothetical protein [Planctomycetota bacterium]MBI3833647.1 hypothetical protein [Planctomycetota bacterium]